MISRVSRSAIPFVRAGTREPIEALRQAEIRASSRSLRWTGVVAELGVNPSWETDHLAVAGHYIAINLADAPLRFERKQAAVRDHPRRARPYPVIAVRRREALAALRAAGC
ncbi:hypothetical protein [Sorangium sp. So ce117]|uniref:hypothetical protein n=1 Tax=Sorangium sp. So ce117 TaxID=3133277 RepID=UPI003F5D63B2